MTKSLSTKDLKKGTRVKVVLAPDFYINGNTKLDKNFLLSLTGTIIHIQGASTIIGVEFDKFIDGHSCDNRGREGYCRYFYFRESADKENISVFQSSNNLALLFEEQLEFDFG